MGPSPSINPDTVRLEALAEFAAGAGHEINNPLATIIGRTQQLLKDESDPQRRQILQSIGAQAYRIRDMIGDTMLFARPPKPEIGEINLAEIASRVISNQAESFELSGCSIEPSISEVIGLRADPNQLSIVISELLRNSRQALQPNGGVIQIRASVITGDLVQIEVEDQGIGFSETDRVHAFDPFYSGRQAGRGLGFGLPKCWQIIRQHGGRIEIEAPSAGPTIVRCFLPL
jgi:signal transduction histidine kinase